VRDPGQPGPERSGWNDSDVGVDEVDSMFSDDETQLQCPNGNTEKERQQPPRFENAASDHAHFGVDDFFDARFFQQRDQRSIFRERDYRGEARAIERGTDPRETSAGAVNVGAIENVENPDRRAAHRRLCHTPVGLAT